MFFYQDHDQETLLISFDKNGKELYVWNYDSIDYCRTIQVGHNFSLHQKPDNTLIMHNTDDEFFSEINLKYAKIQAEYEFPKTVLSQNPLRDVKKLFVRDEGLIVGSDDLRRDEVSLHLSRKMFDLTLLADEQRQRLTGTRSNKLRPITCYHKTYTGEIILGHDGGIVSIWKPIKEEAS
jgi:hypothetical protein